MLPGALLKLCCLLAESLLVLLLLVEALADFSGLLLARLDQTLAFAKVGFVFFELSPATRDLVRFQSVGSARHGPFRGFSQNEIVVPSF